jgi:Domain of unknown function (DUF1842)
MAEENPIGYYIVSVQVSPPGLAGAKTLKMKLGVNAPNGHVQGSGEVTQALPPPFGTTPIPHISGHLQPTPVPELMMVHLIGEAIVPPPPNQPITITEKFVASLVINRQWEGTGSFTVGSNTVTHCKVTKIER